MSGRYTLESVSPERSDTVTDRVIGNAYQDRYDFHEGRDGEINIKIRVDRTECSMPDAVNKVQAALEFAGFLPG